MKRKKIFSRTVILLSLVSLFNDISSEMLIPVLPAYLSSIGFTALWIGVLEGLAEAVSGLSKGYFGKLSDSYNHRAPFVRWGYAMSAVSKSMLVLSTFLSRKRIGIIMVASGLVPRYAFIAHVGAQVEGNDPAK